MVPLWLCALKNRGGLKQNVILVPRGHGFEPHLSRTFLSQTCTKYICDEISVKNKSVKVMNSYCSVLHCENT